MTITKLLSKLLAPCVGALTIASLVVVSLAVPACGDTDATTQNDQLRYSGEELFAGLLMNAGPVAGSVPSLSPEYAVSIAEDLSDDQWADAVAAGAQMLRERGLDQAADELEMTPREDLLLEGSAASGDDISELVVALIAAEDPEFFEHFATEIQSGDHYRVAVAMGEAGDHLLDAYTALSIGQAGSGSEDAGFCILVFYGGIVFVHTAAVVLMAAAVVVAYNSVSVAGFGGEAGSLRGEVVIDEVTRTFADL